MCPRKGVQDRVVEQDRGFPVQIMEEIVEASPASQILEEIVKVVYEEVDTFSRAEVHVEPRLLVVFSFQCVRAEAEACAHIDSRSVSSLWLHRRLEGFGRQKRHFGCTV